MIDVLFCDNVYECIVKELLVESDRNRVLGITYFRIDHGYQATRHYFHIVRGGSKILNRP